MLIKSLGLGLLLAAASASLSAADAYKFDNSHTEVGFKISHWVINKVHGSFDAFDGSLSYDEKNPEKSSVEVSIDAASINTRNGMRDKHLKSPDFFDVEKNPKLIFKSEKISKSADGKALEISGDLTMRGVTKPVTLHTVITGKMDDNFGNSRIGFEASTTVNRLDFGIAWNKSNKTGTSMLGDKVEIQINGEATLKK
jgi:polyisoprenoid-binding protein YceI